MLNMAKSLYFKPFFLMSFVFAALSAASCGKKDSKNNEIIEKPGPIALVCDNPETCQQGRPEKPSIPEPEFTQHVSAELLTPVPDGMSELASSVYIFSSNDLAQYYYFPKEFVPEKSLNAALNLPSSTVDPGNWGLSLEFALVAKDNTEAQELSLIIARTEKALGISLSQLPTKNIEIFFAPQITEAELSNLVCEDKSYEEDILDRVQVKHKFSLNYKHCSISPPVPESENVTSALSLPVATLADSLTWSIAWEKKAYNLRTELTLYPEFLAGLGDQLLNPTLLQHYHTFMSATYKSDAPEDINILIDIQPILLAPQFAALLAKEENRPYLIRNDLKALIEKLVSCEGSDCALRLWKQSKSDLSAHQKLDLNTTARSLETVTDFIVREYFQTLYLVAGDDIKDEDSAKTPIFFLSEDMSRFAQLEKFSLVSIPANPNVQDVVVESAIDLQCLFFERLVNSSEPSGFSLDLKLSESCLRSSGVF